MKNLVCLSVRVPNTHGVLGRNGNILWNNSTDNCKQKGVYDDDDDIS